MGNEEKVLARIRKIALALPESAEVKAWGHPNFRVAGKTFAVFERYKGKLCLCVKVGKAAQPLFLADARYFITPYVGKHGWVSLILDRGVDWEEAKELITSSYGLVAPKRLIGNHLAG